MRLSRLAHWRLIVPTLLTVVCASTVRLSAQPWTCPEKPVEPCFKHHGRLSSQNGRALTVWLIGTTRRVQVANGLERLPAAVGRYLSMTSPEHSYIYGDFEICPLEPDTPGHMRQVCVAGAEKLVVENLRGLHPFRLLSTWPDSKSRPQR
jgi:hypothetical protein